MKQHHPIGPLAEDEHDHDPALILGTNQSDSIILEHGAGGGPQHIIGGNGEDTVSAGGGPDTIEGGNGKDLLRGDGGPDLILGGNGADTLVGGEGPDTLTGGNGPDVFVFTASSDDDHGPGPGGGGHEDSTAVITADEGGGGHDGGRRETITDFTPGLDRIDLSALDGVTGFADDPAANSAWVEQDGENSILRVDTDGVLAGEHGGAELSVVLLGVDAASVTASDFLF